MTQSNRKPKTPYEKKLFWRRTRMYLVWGLTFVACLAVSLISFNQRYFKTVDPQIKRAYIQIAKLMPAMEADEASLAATYALLAQSREDAKKMGITLSSDTIAETRSVDEISAGAYISNRITRLTVGHNGFVAIVRKDTGEIVAHPDPGRIGKTLLVSPINNRDIVDDQGNALATSVANYKGIPSLDLSAFADANDTQDSQSIRLRRLFFFSGDDEKIKLSAALKTLFIGSIVPYRDYYIVCGINMLDYTLFMSRAIFISIVACVILWLFVHFIALTLDRHELDGKDLRRQLTAYSLVLALAVFGIGWYVQALNNVTSDLNALQSYAESGVDRLNAFQATRQQINDWFDDQYLIQCRIARDYVKSKGVENITRQDLAKLSASLGVRHIYVYDREGTVAVTNSPYDHFTLSDDPARASSAFLPLLEGADHVVQQPRPDEVAGERVQLIGVSLRDEQDRANGFVQISVDPALRDYLVQPLGVESVLADMTVGLPSNAMAVDRESLTIVATTGLGYPGQSIEDFGYNADKLKNARNGFLRRGEKRYCAGFGESEEYWLVPVAERSSNTASFWTALRIALVILAGEALILLMALYRYQSDVADAAPPPEEPEPEAPETETISISETAMHLSGLDSLVKVQQKFGFENRWHVPDAKTSLTPGERVKGIAYKLLLVFCVINLLPVLYGSLSNDNIRISGLSYVLADNWEKGPNIFAVTSCLFLLFALYVFVSLTNRVLYNIARVSDMRMETICLLLRSSLKYVCVIVFIYYGLSQFGIPTQALLASAGIITLAVSMGAKDMVNDIIAGFFILLEGNFKVGDFITVGGWFGTVEEIGLRTTRVSFQHETKIINNSSIRDIINSDKPKANLILKLPVGITANLAELEAIFEKELPALMEDVPGVLGKPRYGGVDKFEGGNMVVRLTVAVETVMKNSIGREFNRRVKLMLERNGIDLPVNPAYHYDTDITPDKKD